MYQQRRVGGGGGVARPVAGGVARPMVGGVARPAAAGYGAPMMSARLMGGGVVQTPRAYGAGVAVQSPRVMQSPMSPRIGAGYGQPQVIMQPGYGQPVAYGQPQMMIQSPYGQPVAYGQPAAPQPAMMGMFQPPPPVATPQQRAMCQKINELSDYPKYMNKVKPYFDKIAGARGKLDIRGAHQFLVEASTGLLGGPLSGADDVDPQEFQRYDFEGEGVLSFVECAKMLKGNMIEMQRRLNLAPEVPVPNKTPEQAGYKVGKVLASGGQGSVALATGARGEVALKIYDKNNENAATIEDLRTEMEVMQVLERSPHIMHSYEIFQDAGHFYCVDELLPGGDLCCLREKAQQNGIRLDEMYFRNIFSQCGGALEYMHRHAMMHCDIKEPNIMFKSKDYRNPQVALIDFGMSKWSASDGMAGGTPGYRPPETNETNVWFPRGDMFSLGVTFFQLLANKVPDEKTMAPGIFTEGAQSMEDVIFIVKTRQPPWHLMRGQYPGVMAWLPSLLDKQMNNRPTAPQLLHMPWFQQAGAAADAILPETGWIMPDANFNDDDLANIPPAQPQYQQAAPMQQGIGFASQPRIVQAHEIQAAPGYYR